MITKRIVCLANSRKMNGRCFAGRELVGGEPGPWVRPVSARVHREVSDYESQYADGSEPRLLDIIELPLLRHEPRQHQTENWILDPESYWQKKGEAKSEALADFVDSTGSLWVNGYSSGGGMNDRVPGSAAAVCKDSLRLIEVANASLRVETNFYKSPPVKKLRVRFMHLGTPYILRVTDPAVELRYSAEPDGDYPMEQHYFTVSLGELFGDYAYKLVAAVISVAPAGVR